jgi:hypothetical protein
MVKWVPTAKAPARVPPSGPPPLSNTSNKAKIYLHAFGTGTYFFYFYTEAETSYKLSKLRAEQLSSGADSSATMYSFVITFSKGCLCAVVTNKLYNLRKLF